MLLKSQCYEHELQGTRGVTEVDYKYPSLTRSLFLGTPLHMTDTAATQLCPRLDLINP